MCVVAVMASSPAHVCCSSRWTAGYKGGDLSTFSLKGGGGRGRGGGWVLGEFVFPTPLKWNGILDTSFSKIFVGRHTKTKSSGLAYSLCACGALHVWGTVIKGVVFSYICFGHNIQTPSQGQKKKREETLSCVFI
jgi:hypothetical protein